MIARIETVAAYERDVVDLCGELPYTYDSHDISQTPDFNIQVFDSIEGRQWQRQY